MTVRLGFAGWAAICACVHQFIFDLGSFSKLARFDCEGGMTVMEEQQWGRRDGGGSSAMVVILVICRSLFVC